MSETNQTPNQQNTSSYKPPLFKKDFFDSLLKNQIKKDENENFEEPDLKQEENGLVGKALNMINNKKKDDPSVHQVNKI